MKKSGVHVYRDLAPENSGAFKDAQNILSEIPTFTRHLAPHLTILYPELTKHASQHTMEGIVYPLPTSAREEITLPVGELEIIRKKRFLAYYFLRLDDPESSLHDEIALLKKRHAEQNGKFMSFPTPLHITLGSVDPLHALESKLPEVQALLPETLTFTPVKTRVKQTEEELPATGHKYMFERAIPVRSERRPFTGDVRTFEPNAIPEAFLRAINATRQLGRDAVTLAAEDRDVDEDIAG